MNSKYPARQLGLGSSAGAFISQLILSVGLSSEKLSSLWVCSQRRLWLYCQLACHHKKTIKIQFVCSDTVTIFNIHTLNGSLNSVSSNKITLQTFFSPASFCWCFSLLKNLGRNLERRVMFSHLNNLKRAGVFVVVIYSRRNFTVLLVCYSFDSVYVVSIKSLNLCIITA